MHPTGDTTHFLQWPGLFGHRSIYYRYFSISILQIIYLVDPPSEFGPWIAFRLDMTLYRLPF